VQKKVYPSELPLRIEDAPDPQDVAFVEDSLDAYNIAMTDAHDYRPLAIFVRDKTGAIAAGLTAFTWGGTLKIGYLWLREDWRRHGYGSRMLLAAEDEARARGCRQSILETHEFQAPAFYPRHGYTLCGVAEDWPLGYKHYHFQKRLDTPDIAKTEEP
jgi:GNAT superfamily N-acetyltransferase